MNAARGPKRPSQSLRGFVLIIVLALLGVMAFLALELVEHSRQARTLSSASMLDTHTHLLARSGIEKGRQKLMAVITGGSLAPPMEVGELEVVLPVPADGRVLVHLGDANGKICLNDGIAAGKAENKSHPIPGGYKADALDPWPSAGIHDVSAWINYRLRSILNSYGDIHKFAAEIGWPTWELELDANGNEVMEPTYGQTPLFKHTATQSGPSVIATNTPNPGWPILFSSPPRLLDGTAISNPLLSAGLGDRIIGARPAGGYVQLEQVRTLVNDWGREFLPPAYHGGDFFAKVTQDFTITAWNDTAFWRMRREFARDDTLFTGQAATPPFNNFIGHVNFGLRRMQFCNVPPDLTDIWRPHPHPPVNINAASLFVRAAVFQAPHSVSVSEEAKISSASPPFFRWPPTSEATAGQMPPFALGVGYVGQCGKENGVNTQIVVTGPTLMKCQAGKLLSVRDALIASRAYSAIAQVEGWPDDFERFSWHLRRVVKGARSVENDNPWEKIYPHVFSAQRRLPSWMGAPIALVSEIWDFITLSYSHPFNGGGLSNVAGSGQNLTTASGTGCRRIEDFVFRSHLPKVCFRSNGLYVLDSEATLAQGSLNSRRSIRTTLKAFETTVMRDQASFLGATDTSAQGTSPEIMIGPEVEAIASAHLGTVGLKDRGTSLPGSGVKAAVYDFDGTLDAQPGASIHHENPQNDPHNLAGSGYTYVDSDLLGSSLEDGGVSIFPKGAGFDPRDLSPFGGVYFSPFRHGIFSAPRFSDSFYFRPETFLSTPSPSTPGNLVSELGGKGLISLWVRVPTLATGGQADLLPLQVFHLTLWERRDTLRSDGTLDVGRLRPVTLALSCMPKSNPIFQAPLSPLMQGHLQYEFEFQVGVGNASKVVGTQQETWPNLANIPLPVSQADFLTSSVYNSMLFPWIAPYDPALWQNQFTAPKTQTSPFETGLRERWRLNTVSTSPDGIDDFGPNPYVFRAGSWVRLTCLWDAGAKTSLRNRFTLVPHSLKGVTVDTVADKSPGVVNPKMCLSFGETIFQNTGPFFGLTGPHLIPSCRLHSMVDNVVIQFGGYPGALALPTAGPEITTADRAPRWQALENISGFDSRRYDIRDAAHTLGINEPAWVINPGLPQGSRLLEFGARIYDVPFYPHYAPDMPDPNNVPVCPPEPQRVNYATQNAYNVAYNAYVAAAASYRNYMNQIKAHIGWTTWPVKAPRIEMDVLDFSLANPASAPILPTQKSLPVVERNIGIKSPAWGRYEMPVADNLRLRLKYMSRDTDDRPLDKVLTDIPYIQEINWRWIPPGGGIKILSWEQE